MNLPTPLFYIFGSDGFVLPLPRWGPLTPRHQSPNRTTAPVTMPALHERHTISSLVGLISTRTASDQFCAISGISATIHRSEDRAQHRPSFRFAAVGVLGAVLLCWRRGEKRGPEHQVPFPAKQGDLHDTGYQLAISFSTKAFVMMLSDKVVRS